MLSLGIGSARLISPAAVTGSDREHGVIRLDLDAEQVQSHPEAGEVPTASRRWPTRLNQLYGFPSFWRGRRREMPTSRATAYEAELHSARELVSCQVHLEDALLGPLRTLWVDDEEWLVRYLVADGANSLGRSLLLPVNWAHRVELPGNVVHVSLTRAIVADSPPIDAERSFARADEERIYPHYGAKGYWEL